jgi:hypothetical protein
MKYAYITRKQEQAVFDEAESRLRDPINTNPFKGIKFVGPFDKPEEAALAAVRAGENCFTIIHLHEPK